MENIDQLLSQISLTKPMAFEPTLSTIEYLGILTKCIQQINEKFKDQINKPIICGEWDDHYTYEPFSIVSYNSDSYMSIEKVPQRIPITDTNYWIKVGDFNAKLDTKSRIVISENIPEPSDREKNTVYYKITNVQDNSIVHGIGVKIEE